MSPCKIDNPVRASACEIERPTLTPIIALVVICLNGRQSPSLGRLMSLPPRASSLSLRHSVVVAPLCRWWRACFLLTLASLVVLHLNYTRPPSPLTDWISPPAAAGGSGRLAYLTDSPDAVTRELSDSTSSFPPRLSRRASLTAHWAFPSSVDVTSTHAAFLSLVSLLTDTPIDTVSLHEAVLLDSQAVASLHDLTDLDADRPPAEYDVDSRQPRRDMSVHIVNTGSQAALEAQLEGEGYSGWTAHNQWTKERMVVHRGRAAQFMFPAINTMPLVNGSATADESALLNDGADIDFGRLHFMNHIDVLLALSSSSPSTSLALVLESEAVLTPFFRQRMEWVARNVPDNFTAVFVAGCLNLHPELDRLPPTASESTPSSPCSPVTETGIIKSCTAPPHRPTPLLLPTIRSRCTSGYLVSASSAARILSAVQTVTRTQTTFVPISHTLNAAFELLSRQTGRSTVYQMEPPASYERGRILHPANRNEIPVSSIRAVNYSRQVKLGQKPQPRALSLPGFALSPVRPTARCEMLCSWQRPLASPMLSRVQSASGADWSSYISPTAFRDMADWVYWRHREVLQPHDPLVAVNHTVAIECFTAGALVYVQTSMIVRFFDEVHPNIRQPYFLLTGSADTTTPGDWERYLDPNADGSPSMLMHWFGQNGNSTHAGFTNIPIGIPLPMADALDLTLHGQNSLVIGEMYEEDSGGGGSTSNAPDSGSGAALHTSRYHPRIVQFRWDSPGDFDEDKWLLVNFDVNTNTAERLPAFTIMCGNRSAGVAGVPFAHCVEKEHGTSQYYSSMRATYHRDSRYRFRLSPPGNGMDCHRTWEAIYLGVVPVVKRGPLDGLFVDLPVLLVDQWDELNADMLSGKWDAMTKRYGGAVLDKLHFGYWRQLIVDTAIAEMRARDIAVDGTWTDTTASRRRCWGRVVM